MTARIDPTVCLHKRREDVLDGLGKAVAVRCRGCSTILGMLGACPGCDQHWGLLAFPVEHASRDATNVVTHFHSADCGEAYARRAAYQRRERVKKFKASQTKIPGCD